jgi:hypothetical protein
LVRQISLDHMRAIPIGHFGGQCSVKIVIVQFEHLMPRRYLLFPIMLSEAGIGRFQRSA